MKSEVRTLARIGRITYTNCIPFYHRLNEGDLAFHETYPAEVNRALREGDVDIAPVSSLEYLNRQSDYLLLPGFSITARNFSGSVLLFSKEKIENLNGKSIALSRESLSSAALLRALLKFRFNFENTFETVPSNPDEMLSRFPAALVIGDDALFYQPKEFVYKYDLSELWWSWMNKPFCFAVWAVRREYALAQPEEVTLFCKRLRKNLDKNLSDIETLVREGMGLNFWEEKFPKVFGYLFNLNYSLDSEIQEGLKLFYGMAHRLQTSPKPAPLEFFNPSY